MKGGLVQETTRRIAYKQGLNLQRREKAKNPPGALPLALPQCH